VTLPSQTLYRKFRVFQFDFDANESALLLDGYPSHRAGAQERIQNAQAPGGTLQNELAEMLRY
jgi:hypothetical protein